MSVRVQEADFDVGAEFAALRAHDARVGALAGVALLGGARADAADSVASATGDSAGAASAAAGPASIEGVVVGNEVLDAMPVHLMSWDGQRWLERGVGLTDTGFIWVDRPAPEGVRPPSEHPDSDFVPGTVTETHGQAEAFVVTLAERMTRGAAFFLDYGFPEAEYYLPQRTGGTLMCHHLHQSDPDPLVQVGEKDITSHVNFTGIALAGQEAGWEVLGYTSQGRFLTNCGLGDALAQTGQASTAVQFKARAAMQMLLAEHEMGELFKVIGFVKGPWFEAIGFAHGDRTHTL